MPEPWNVQDIVISTDGIEVHQFGESYARNHGKPGPRKPEEDELCWCLLFKQEQLRNIHVKETACKVGEKFVNTLIEMVFDYNGVSKGTNATRYKVSAQSGATEVNDDGEKGMGATEEQGKKWRMKRVKLRRMKKGIVKQEGSGNYDPEKAVPIPEDFPLAKLLNEPSGLRILEVRLACFNSKSAKRP